MPFKGGVLKAFPPILLLPIFTDYYQRVKRILETMQGVLDTDGPRKEVNVSADAAALQVRKIITSMVADETGTGYRRAARLGRRPSTGQSLTVFNEDSP